MNSNDELKAAQKNLNAVKAKIYQEQLASTPQTTVASKAAARKAAKQAKYKTKNGLTIDNLRLAGNDVKVTHIRYAEVIGVPHLVPVPSYLRDAYEFSAKAGATHIIITKPNGLFYSVSSVCHETDAFDYKLGVKTALDLLNQQEATALLASNAVAEVLEQAA